MVSCVSNVTCMCVREHERCFEININENGKNKMDCKLCSSKISRGGERLFVQQWQLNQQRHFNQLEPGVEFWGPSVDSLQYP